MTNKLKFPAFLTLAKSVWFSRERDKIFACGTIQNKLSVYGTIKS